MSYDFRSLLPADFEDLARDLIGAKLGVRFEGFGPGPDGGIDGRHATAKSNIILQAKHYADSNFATLKSAMKRERTSVDALMPDRYVLVTSRPLTPPNKAQLAKIIGPALKSEADIFGQTELNDLLREYPAIQRAHLKLWLSSSAVLDAVINASSYAFTATAREEIEAKVRVYAQNPSLADARGILDKRHVLIISGPPGVGKTTLAEILAFAYLGESWELIAMQSLDDGFARIHDSKRQIFFFDDFLGTIALDRWALSATDSSLSKFLNRVHKSPNARFILTTRAYILHEAQEVSERLADKRVHISTYVLDLSSYSREIRARILYNHLVVGETPAAHLEALLDSGLIPEIVDHENYNPRVIEWMTDALRIEEIESAAYPEEFVRILDNPAKLWDTAFRTHISPASRHLLIALFFVPTSGRNLDELRATFEALHHALCQKFALEQDPKDFESSLKRLEGGFLEITDGRVSFINPSVDDYLADYLSDGQLLNHVADSITNGISARTLWNFAIKLNASTDLLTSIAAKLVRLIPRLLKVPARKWDTARSFKSVELDNADRIWLLFRIWQSTDRSEFLEAAIAAAENPAEGFTAWSDGSDLIDLIELLNNEDDPRLVDLQRPLEAAVSTLFMNGMGTDDLEAMADRILASDQFNAGLVEAAKQAVWDEIDNAYSSCESMTSESSLDEHAEALRRLASKAGVDPSKLKLALSYVDDRIAELRDERDWSSEEPNALPTKAQKEKVFDDEALEALFGSLRQPS